MLRPPGTLPPSLGPSTLLADRYRIERELGRGGMAVVYLAHDTRHDRRVAIKFIGDELGSAVGTQRFLQEIRLTAALQHPHVLPVYDSGVTSDNVLYYVMPFVEGGSLRSRLAEGPLPIAEAVKVARDVASALSYAHQRGIVHRDIKPENILFSDGLALVADFGIARLVTSTGAQQLTAVGIVVGTPAYMSPEQGFGAAVDHRSDVYSLACVVYEMLTGKVPFASPAAGQWTPFGLSRMPPPMRGERPEVPEALEEEVVRALAPSPDDRHPTAREFAEALDRSSHAATPAVAVKTTGRTKARRAWRSGLVLGAIVTFVALVISAFFATRVREQLVALGVIDLDPALALVAPFEADSSRLASVATAAERHLRAELSRWSDLKLVTSDQARDLVGATGERLSLAQMVRAGRQSRAGLVVWGRAGTEAGVEVVETRFVNPEDGTIAGTTVTPPLATDTAWARWARLTAAELLAGTQLPRRALAGIGGTRSMAAWRAYVRGHRELEEWRLPAADSAFAAAIAADPRFAPARVWFAQTMIWRRRGTRNDWRRHAEESLLLAGALSDADQTIARAVAAMGRREDPRACAEYGKLVSRDSLDAAGWLGLGDCGAIDSVVVRNVQSPSGYAFRGNLAAALRAYERAVRLAPGAHNALPAMFLERHLLYTQPERYRHGVAADDSSAVFGARPEPRGDSVVYVPYRVLRNALPSDPPQFEEGLRRNRAHLLEYVTAWTQRLPGSMDAHEALAQVQEGRGELTGVAAGGRASAMVALDSAQRLAATRADGARISAARVRVLLKAGEFARARQLADSMLARSSEATASEAHWLAGVAAFTGRAREAARLARLGDAPPVQGWDTIPAPIGEAATLLYVQAAAGVCSNEFRQSFQRLDALIDSYTAPAARASVRLALTARPRRLALPCLGSQQVQALPARTVWERMQNRLATGDTRGVRLLFDSLAQMRRFRRPGHVAIDFTFTEAWVLAAIGDSTAAARHLDVTLEGLAALSRNALWELAQSAAVPRTMAYRATLAHALGDVQNASRWATAAATLWKNADAELQPDVARLLNLSAR